MTKQEKAIREFCGHHADWWPSTTQVQEMLALAQPDHKPVKDWIASHNEICALLRQAHDALALTSYPPQRTWVGLTNGEMIELSEMKLGSWDLILEVEDKLRSKNSE